MLVQTLERDHRFDKREDPSIIIGMNLEEDEDFLPRAWGRLSNPSMHLIWLVAGRSFLFLYPESRR